MESEWEKGESVGEREGRGKYGGEGRQATLRIQSSFKQLNSRERELTRSRMSYFPMNPHVCLLVGCLIGYLIVWSVGWLVGWSVCYVS